MVINTPPDSLSKIPPGPPGGFSLYVHIPFCTRKCDYCHFYVIPEKEDHKDLLMAGLKKEWERIKHETDGLTLHTLYFGGGTPFLLGPERISTLIEWFNPPAGTEITLEANPENVTLPLMKAYRKAGINRVSIGIQTLDNGLLKRLNRLHDGHTAKEAVIITAEAGISNISVDLMYDLPGQDLAMWQNTVSQVKELPITHLSLYNLTIEPHTVFFKNRAILERMVPDEETSLQMYETAVAELEKAGLQQYEISAFAKPGKHSHHNVGYWTARPFLGLGPSAFSYWNKRRFRNIANLHKYCRDDNPVDFDELLSSEEQLKELLTIRIRLLEGVNVAEFQKAFGELDNETLATLDRLCGDGLLERADGCVRLTRKGILFYDTVAVELI